LKKAAQNFGAMALKPARRKGTKNFFLFTKRSLPPRFEIIVPEIPVEMGLV
jgi:hypothetical protein